MKRDKILFWVFTVLLILSTGYGAVLHAISEANSVTMMQGLGYPAYIVPFIGVAKILALIAIVFPGSYPRIKEWAYAGMFFDLAGATYSIFCVGPVSAPAFIMFIFIGFLAGSYIFYHRMARAKGLATV